MENKLQRIRPHTEVSRERIVSKDVKYPGSRIRQHWVRILSLPITNLLLIPRASYLSQQSPTFLALGTSFIKDNFSKDRGQGKGWFQDDSSILHLLCTRASQVAQMVNSLSAMRETWVQSLGWEDPLEKEMATRSNTLAWKILWMEETGRLQTLGSQRVRHDWATSLVQSS